MAKIIIFYYNGGGGGQFSTLKFDLIHIDGLYLS